MRDRFLLGFSTTHCSAINDGRATTAPQPLTSAFNLNGHKVNLNLTIQIRSNNVSLGCTSPFTVTLRIEMQVILKCGPRDRGSLFLIHRVRHLYLGLTPPEGGTCIFATDACRNLVFIDVGLPVEECWHLWDQKSMWTLKCKQDLCDHWRGQVSLWISVSSFIMNKTLLCLQSQVLI